MEDVSLVKTEIKAWERDFKQRHGRGPTVQDIKQHPPIADKYRLYKKLSKAPPTTLALPHSHPPQPTAPLTSFNPFSPQKDRRNNTPHRPSNPKSSPTPSTALSRARKRLRGEPVSPSPQKGKRPRLGSQTLPVSPDSSSSSEDDDQPHPHSSSFLSNSPVKVPRGPKSFKLLFHDTNKSTKADPSTSTSTLQTKSTPHSRGLFGNKLFTAANTLDDGSSSQSETYRTTLESMPSKSSITPPPIENHVSHNSMKHSLSTSVTEATHPPPASRPPLLPPSPPPSSSSIRPPNKFASKNPKSKTANSTSRKKTKTAFTSDNSNGEESAEDAIGTSSSVKVVNHTRLRNNSAATMRQQNDEGDFDPDLDPILAHALRDVPHGSPQPPHAQLEDTFEVDLPDKLRNVLALESAEPKSRNFREERLVKALVSGTRVTHYDPGKGGEIWDVGEDNPRRETDADSPRDVEEEDDWEGEPVPWEVGEL